MLIENLVGGGGGGMVVGRKGWGRGEQRTNAQKGQRICATRSKNSVSLHSIGKLEGAKKTLPRDFASRLCILHLCCVLRSSLHSPLLWH